MTRCALSFSLFLFPAMICASIPLQPQHDSSLRYLEGTNFHRGFGKRMDASKFYLGFGKRDDSTYRLPGE
ncbi:hypothetical protein Tcan_08403 [Toxocara canis]|uniref:Uncharacterized protein n=1 Tax=Toxocara canis TaxID=6265 RepID=A0A0B2VTV0_TOXCA|nr:hypothetical protein Tcan_08403 [Toxocara canis]